MKNTLQHINELALNDPSALVLEAENAYIEEINNIAKVIAENDDLKIVSIAGPSASGKTTTAHILRDRLNQLGESTEVVSLDDFYLPTENLPILEDGTRDIESVAALDINLINRCFNEIIRCGKTLLPRYVFAEKRRIPDARQVDISKRGIIIAEGLHAINPLITSCVPRKNIFKAYISVNSPIKDVSGKKILSSRQIRLARRVLRDRSYRGASVNETLALWNGVVEGEQKNLYCFKDEADVQIKTLHYYEPCVYKDEFLNLKNEITETSPCREYFLRTAAGLEEFVSLKRSFVPDGSLIREFIGNGKYN